MSNDPVFPIVPNGAAAVDHRTANDDDTVDQDVHDAARVNDNLDK